eukprot:8776011-Karenia_brevis.AAC.1
MGGTPITMGYSVHTNSDQSSGHQKQFTSKPLEVKKLPRPIPLVLGPKSKKKSRSNKTGKMEFTDKGSVDLNYVIAL